MGAGKERGGAAGRGWTGCGDRRASRHQDGVPEKQERQEVGSRCSLQPCAQPGFDR